MNIKETERLLKALANKRRLAIVQAVKKEELPVGDIAEKIRLSLRSTSRHLGVLRGADVLERDQRGLQVFYRISPGFSQALKDAMNFSLGA